MTIVAIPNIRDLGVVPNNNMEEPEYNAASEAFTGQMPGWGADNKAVAEAGRTNALHAASAADSASSSASTANGRAEAASASAGTASTKAGEAADSASSAATSLAAMQKLYLGNKAAHPTVDNQGAALQKGAWYTNSTNSYWYWWNGANWIVGVGDLSAVDWATQVINKPTNLVTTDTVQTIAALKRMSGNLVVGSATPNANTSLANPVTQLGDHNFLVVFGGNLHLTNGLICNAAGAWFHTRTGSDGTVWVLGANGGTDMYRAPSGTAGAAATLTKYSRLDFSGNFSVTGNVTAFGAP